MYYLATLKAESKKEEEGGRERERERESWEAGER